MIEVAPLQLFVLEIFRIYPAMTADDLFPGDALFCAVVLSSFAGGMIVETVKTTASQLAAVGQNFDCTLFYLRRNLSKRRQRVNYKKYFEIN